MRALPIAALALCAGCSHSVPFETDGPGGGGPIPGTPPLQLTYNIGQDGWAAWSPDGTSLRYSTQDSFSIDKDRCIARLAAAGGTRIDLICPDAPAGNGLTEIFDQPALLGGLLAFSSSELGIDEHSPFRHALWMAVDTPLARPRRIMDFPYTAPSGRSHDAPLFLQWLKPGVLLFLGAENGCCRKDTLRFGEQVVLLDLASVPPARSFVPGTTRASAVQAAADGTAIYYTIAGDSRVYQQVLATGAVTILHDFGSGRVARDPQVRGSRLYAIVDGHDGFGDSPPFLAVQVDYGGSLTTVDLGTGVEAPLGDAQHLYKRPRLAPDGSRLVVEAYPMSVTEQRDPDGNLIAADTTVSRWADLWLMED